jgi:TonB-linked SusC/RagA family outer membrane protein
MKNSLFSKVFLDKRRLHKPLLIMKLITLLLTVLSLNLSASVYSQKAKFTLDLNGKTVREVFQVLEQQSKFRFFYNDDFNYIDKVVNLSVKDQNVEQILAKLFESSDITYRVLDNNLVVLTLKQNLQQLSIKGVITDATSGEALVGVSVVVQGTTLGTVTDANGKYSIEVPSQTAVLSFSYVGYQKQEVTVGANVTIDIKLASETQKLDEVVVVGYGTLKKTSITGAISPISAKEITQLSVASVESALQGKAAGVSVVNNGTPGSAPIVRIRGNGSISFAADPLYVIDGFPTTDITAFDSKDIESVEVLKDASSASIYGSRAANGVVLITTKKGVKDGKVHINLDSYYGTQSIIKKLKLLNTPEYLEFADRYTGGAVPPRLANNGAGLDQPIYPGATQTYRQTNTDWQDALFKTAPITQTNLSFSSSSDKSIFYGSAGYFKQDGVMVNTSYQRNNFRFNSEHALSKHITVGQTVFYSYGNKFNEKQTQGRPNVMHALRSLPYLPITAPEGSFINGDMADPIVGGYRASNSAIDGSDADNPIKIQKLYGSTTSTAKLFGTLYLELKLTSFLKFRTTAGLDYVNITNSIDNPIYYDGFNANTLAGVSKERFENTTKLFSNQLTFDKKWTNHALNVVVVQEEQPYTSNHLYTFGNLATNKYTELSGLSNINATGDKQQTTLLSYVGRLNYTFMNRYILNAAIRTDGSSKFATGKKWGTFPSVSVAWRVNEESFLKDVKELSELKIRAGYGIVGFNGIGSYDWQSIVKNDNQYVLNNTIVDGSEFNALANKQLTWETSKMTNIGFDLGLFGNKFTLSAEYFNKLTTDLILAIPYPGSIGYYSPAIANIGSMKNYGTEFELSYQINAGELKSTLSGNMSFIRNKVTQLTTGGAPIDAGYNQDYGGYNFTRTAVGQPVQSFYGWKVDHIFQNQAEIDASAKQPGAAPGDIKFKDINGDGIIDGNDRIFLGSYMPKFTYGFNYTAAFKNFDLTAFFQGVYGNKIYDGTRVVTEGMLRLFNAGTRVLDAWTPTNTNTDVPRAIGGDPNQNVRTSNRFIENGSYFRLKVLSIGYNVPQKVLTSLTKGNLAGLRIYVSGQNLFTITKYKGYDPEVGSLIPNSGSNGAPGTAGLLTNGIDYGFAPQARTIVGGVQFSF